MIIGVTTTPHGTVGGGLGRAQTVAVADVRDGEVTSWTEVPVGWGDLHGIGPRAPTTPASCGSCASTPSSAS